MNHDKATPRPWSHDGTLVIGWSERIGRGRVLICDCQPDGNPFVMDDGSKANAALIYAAVNAWDDIDLLKARIKELEDKDA